MTVMTDDLPTLRSFSNRAELGRHAGRLAADVVRDAIAARGTARVMLAAAPSQEETLKTFVRQPGIDWAAVECFHMDDYIGLHADAPQGFGNWLQRVVIDHVPAVTFHRMETTGDAAQAAARYGEAMGDEPFDLVFAGLGVNAHLAFNDPPADFSDPLPARVVVLDDVSRQQQVDEGHFPALVDVPETAVTVTIPRLLNSKHIVASVPGRAKRQAVLNTLTQPINADVPGTALRRHPSVTMFLDAESDPR